MSDNEIVNDEAKHREEVKSLQRTIAKLNDALAEHGKPYALGQFDQRAYNHGKLVVDEMRKEFGETRGVAHTVCVAVYADGYLQFVGADSCFEQCGIAPDRMDVKKQASHILWRMSPIGEIARGGETCSR